MENDVGLQRAIMASLQSANARASYAPSSIRPTQVQQSRQVPQRVTRDIAPTMPSNRSAQPTAKDSNNVGRKNTLQKEGILPRKTSSSGYSGFGPPPPLHKDTCSSGSPVVKLPVTKGGGVGGNVTTKNPHQQQPSRPYSQDPNIPTVESGAYDHILGKQRPPVQSSATSTGASPFDYQQRTPISQRAEMLPGWKEIISGCGKVQRQNPSGSHIIAETSSSSSSSFLSLPFPSNEAILLSADTAVSIGTKSCAYTFSCAFKFLSRQIDMVVGFPVNLSQVEEKDGGGNSSNNKLRFQAPIFHLLTSGEIQVSAEAFELDVQSGMLQKVSTLEIPTMVKPLARSDFTNISMVVQKGSLRLSVNGERVFKNVMVAGLDPQSEKSSIGMFIAGGKVSIKNISLAEGDDSVGAGPTVDKYFASKIEDEIMERSPNVQWEDVAGLSEAKKLLNEALVLPMVIPEFFTGIRQPWKGVLLFGPPGTGKTLLAKAVATCAKTTFFNMSASTLVSKFHGESEKMVKALFQLARQHAPSTIFFDEIDALMMKRGEGNEHDASRRLKSEMLSQIDGLSSDGGEGGGEKKQVMVLATTNKPWDLDDAMRRRLEKRIYIPLPDENGRTNLFQVHSKTLPMDETVAFAELAKNSEGYSGADIFQVCRDAAMMPLRKIIGDRSPAEILELKSAGKLESVPVCQEDFCAALKKIQPSVSSKDHEQYAEWFKEFGSA